LIQVKKRGAFLFSTRSCREHCIQVRMVPGEFIAVLEYELFTRAQDKDAALLPIITVHAALAETFSHGLDAADQRCRAQRFPEAALELEGPVRAEVLVDKHLSGEMELLDEMPRTFGATAPDGNQWYSGLIQFFLDAHEGSSLLPCEHSAEMAEKGKHDAPARP